MHEVSVFLTVRHLPKPVVPPSERFVVRVIQPIPNMYQVRLGV